MHKKGSINIALGFVVVFVLILSFSFSLWGGFLFEGESYFPTIISSEIKIEDTAPKGRIATYVKTPDAVKGIYMTSCVAGNKQIREGLIKLIDETELNSLVIDIKTYDGWISYPAKDTLLSGSVGGPCHVPLIQDFIDELHTKNIYVVARIAAFQDPVMVKNNPEIAVKKNSDRTVIWKDYKGISWIDAGAKKQWQYLVALARDARSIGFDEINFDYVRFPSDGDMKDIYYPESDGELKADVLENFFSYLHNNLSKDNIKISADLFGMTTTNPDDLNIGQVLERALPYFDYISPMVYPSHYPPNFNGLGDPNKKPYDVVKYSMDKAVARTIATTTTITGLSEVVIASTTPLLYIKDYFDKKKLRPWLQDNNYPVPYTADMVRAQIQATYDAGLDSWLLWNAGNKYTRAALIEE